MLTKINTHFQVRATGGPTPQSTTSFVMGNRTVGSVNSVGLVEALNVGVSNLTGVVQASDPQEGQAVVYSKVRPQLLCCLHSIHYHAIKCSAYVFFPCYLQDVIMVHVVELAGIRISSTSTNLVTGTKVCIHGYTLLGYFCYDLSTKTLVEFNYHILWATCVADSVSLLYTFPEFT